MARWLVKNDANVEYPFAMTLTADNEEAAKDEWCRIIGLSRNDDPDVQLSVMLINEDGSRSIFDAMR